MNAARHQLVPLVGVYYYITDTINIYPRDALSINLTKHCPLDTGADVPVPGIKQKVRPC